ncbi:MAG: YceI family protein [Ginsengibacter sp.]
MKQILLSACLLLFAVCVHAQEFITHTGFVSFFGQKPFESVRADNHEVQASIDTTTGAVQFHTFIKSFHFKKKAFEEAFDKKYMESDKYPHTDFVGKILNLSDVNFSKPGTYKIVVGGNFTIHNVTRWVSHPGVLTIKKNGIIAKSEFDVKPEGFKVKVPKLLGRRLVTQINVSVDMDFTPKI